MAFTFEYFLDDIRKRGMGIQFGKTPEGKEEALRFKQFAMENGETVHVIRDERKNWAVITNKNFLSVDSSWKKHGLPGMKSY